MTADNHACRLRIGRAPGIVPAMIQLALLRHAKSSWDNPDLDDFDRPLNDRGRAAAPLMGQMLASLRFAPDVVLCSTSKRTRETLDGIAPYVANARLAAHFDDQLYLATPDTMLFCLKTAGKTAKRILLIGHNPGMHVLATTLAQSGDPGLLARMRDKFPTAALAILSLGGETFATMETTGGHLETYITPKDRT